MVAMENSERSSEKKKKPRAGIDIDIGKLDEQLERHLDRVLMLKQKGSSREDDWKGKTRVPPPVDEKWEIDPKKLFLKYKIAHGTFGSVYRSLYDGISVAVKLPDLGETSRRNSLHRMFLQEVSVWSKLDHPNIAKFIGAKQDIAAANMGSKMDKIINPENVVCIVAEYLAGGTLKSYLIRNKKKKLPLKVVIRLAKDIARGLSYMHSMKIVHRDVKPENLLLDKKGRVKIIDFGVSTVESTDLADMTGLTGTLGYMAPEVFIGNPYNHKCDVYSFGICLWEIYCCSKPFPNMTSVKETSPDVYKSSRPEIPECCPNSLADLMKKCWDANPRRRPEMAEVLHMLEAIDLPKGRGLIQDDQPWGCFSIFRRQHRS